MTARKRNSQQRSPSGIRTNGNQRVDFARSYEELMKLAPVPVTPIEREWNEEGDSFKECTLYTDDRSVELTHTVPL